MLKQISDYAFLSTIDKKDSKKIHNTRDDIASERG
jgi:hypothetical protein